ncbi:MAG: carbonic anhydrase [Cyclobacteriaceae bacterium]|nr:carbonic anhydrase [Cyclobacteriaceae bacterium]
MKKYFLGKTFIVCLLLAACSHMQESHLPVTDFANSDPLQRLIEGNQRFSEGNSKHPRQDLQRLQEVENAQNPYAVIISCSDSRVPPEIIFDAGIGDLFVIRTAGNLVENLELGSIEYAVEHLGVELVLVMGHEDCGAVTAFLSKEEAHGHIHDIMEHLSHEKEIISALKKEQNLNQSIHECILANVDHTVRQLTLEDPMLSSKVAAGTLKVVGAIYDMHSGKVKFDTSAD